ncbi:MAG: 3-deoxy-8-phosphooctulonate synthase [Fimbriimonadaceae bacterium]
MSLPPTIRLNGVEIGAPSLTVIAGPCLAESLDLCLSVAERMQTLCADLNLQYIFKASFDKANRSSVHSPRGAGMDEGLNILTAVHDRLGLPVTTDMHLPDQALAVSQAVDLIQIPAFLCRQSDLLAAAAATGVPVNVKKGQFLSPMDAKNIVEKLEGFGATSAMLTERGTTFGYSGLVVDMTAFQIMKGFGVPVCFDATHSAQMPGAGSSTTGGRRDAIPALARAATAAGIDAIFLEVHPDPANALSDAATQWPLNRAEWLLRQVAQIHAMTRSIVA